MKSQHGWWLVLLSCFIVENLCFEIHARAEYEGVPVHGFADATFGRQSAVQIPREEVRGFGTGTLDFYLNPRLSDHVKSLMEFALEPSFDTQSVGIDVERLQVGYQFSDLLTAWVGRFHTPYGFWNTAYHHGAQIQPSIYKPRFVDWEDHAGFMPAHSVGLWLTGKSSLESGKVLYDAWLANGSRNLAGTLDMNIVRDDNMGIAGGVRLAYQFGGGWLNGLQIGLHGLMEEVDAYDNTGTQIAQPMLRVYGAFAALEASSIELSSELYLFSNISVNNPSAVAHSSWAGFIHVGIPISPDITPYFRLERASLDTSDSYFSNLQNGFSYDRALVGIRYNLTASSCIKLEGNYTNVRDTTQYVFAGSYNEGKIQYAINF